MSKEELVKDLLEGNFSHAGERLLDFMQTDFRTGILSLVDGVDKSGGETTWSITKTAVMSEDSTDKTNEEKHESAKSAILETLRSAGIDAITSIIDVLIKLAVRELRSALT